MAEVVGIGGGNYLHRSIDQLQRSMNERGALLHDYKQFADLRNTIVADYTIKASLNNINNNNHSSDNRNQSNNQSPELIEHKHSHQIHQQLLQQQQQHQQQQHFNSSSSPPIVNFSISSQQMNGTKAFGGKSEMQLQREAHNRETKPYKCTQCTKSFANSSYLSQHTRIHLGIKPYRCEICQRKFTQLSHLQQHIRTHTGDKPYKCRSIGCIKSFSQLSNLQSHSRCHASDKPFKCNSCYKCFVDEISLLQHIPKHKDSKHLKTHICQYCGKSYTQDTYLQRHVQKHLTKTEKKSTAASSRAANNSATSSASTVLDHPYWPKVSPDSAATLAESIQQQQQNQYDFVMGQHAAVAAAAQQQQQQNEQNHQNQRNQRNNNENLAVENLVVIRQNANGNHQLVQITNQQNNHSVNHSTGGSSSSTSTTANLPPGSIVVTSSGNFDTKSTTNSAFTPINVLPSHLNSLQHHQLGQRPLYYDTIAFQNKNGVAQSQQFSNPQLIALHQIRNYAHQPGGLMTGEHLLSMGVTAGGGIGKDKGH
ncbi:unnamed protein product [Diamesa hyperborea]